MRAPSQRLAALLARPWTGLRPAGGDLALRSDETATPATAHGGRDGDDRLDVTFVAGEVGPVGGMERVLMQLVGGLLDRGCHVTVVARRCDIPPHPNLTWVRVPGPSRPFILAYISFFVLGSLAAWRHRRGLLHTTGAIVLNRADVSTVHFLHQAFDVRERLRGRDLTLAHRAGIRLGAVASRLAERLCYRPSRTRHLLTVSSGLAREISAFLPHAAPVAVIPNGVDRTRFRPDRGRRAQVRAGLGIDEDALVAVFVGGDWPRKGLDVALEAVHRAVGWHLLVVGAGDIPAYEAQAARLAMSERVHFEGLRPDPAPYYAAADAFLFPTAYEAFSLATLEAAAAGLPLLIPAVNGVEELVDDGVSGWLIDRDADHIAAKLAALGADPAQRERMGRAARAASSRYDWSRVVHEHVEVYRRLSRGS